MQGSHGDWKTWKMKIVMEKSWNMNNWPKVMEFCHQSWNCTKLYHICYQHLGIKHRCRKSFSVFHKTSQMQNREGRWSWKIKKWPWKSHGKIFCQVYGNPGVYLSLFHGVPFYTISLDLELICVFLVISYLYKENAFLSKCT